MNTIVTSRAGKDLISSLCSGLLTIGSRFGGAIDESAAMFSGARDTGLTPREFVDQSRKQNKLSTSILVSHLLISLSASITAVSGIGHKIKSVNNPDHRVELVKEYAMKHFPSHSLLDYALSVEKVTTAKKDTVSLLAIPIVISQSDLGVQLILNVDGCWEFGFLASSLAVFWCVECSG